MEEFQSFVREWPDKNRMKVESFDKHPEETAHREIIEKRKYQLAYPLEKKSNLVQLYEAFTNGYIQP